MDSAHESRSFTWTLAQRRVLIALLMVLCGILAIRLACHRVYVSDPPPPRGARYDEVLDKIDLNTADAATLAALPMIGEKRAQEIINHREQRMASEPGQPVFTQPEDLLLIKGFGRASVQTLRPYLMFPTEPHPATQTRTSW